MIVAEQQSCCFSSFFRAPPTPRRPHPSQPRSPPPLAHTTPLRPNPTTQPAPLPPSISQTKAEKNPDKSASCAVEEAKVGRQVSFKLDYSQQQSRSVGQQNRVMAICEIESHLEERSQSDNIQQRVVIEQSAIIHDYFDCQGQAPPFRPTRSHKVKRLYRQKPN